MRDMRSLRMLNLHGPAGICAVLYLWDYVAEHFPDTGRLDKISSEDIHLFCNVSQESVSFVKDLIRCGFLAQDEDGTYFLPDWREEQPYVARAEERREAGRAAAQKRWDAKAHKGKDKKDAEGNGSAMGTQCSNTNSNTNLKSPPTPPRGGREGNAPVNEIASIYADVLPELPQREEPTEKMRRDIEARWKAGPERQDLEWWRGYFAKVRECPFLMGEGGTWRASLGWLVNRGCMDKVLGGEYPTRAEMDEKREGPGVVRAMSDEEFERMRADEAAAATAPG